MTADNLRTAADDIITQTPEGTKAAAAIATAVLGYMDLTGWRTGDADVEAAARQWITMRTLYVQVAGHGGTTATAARVLESALYDTLTEMDRAAGHKAELRAMVARELGQDAPF